MTNALKIRIAAFLAFTLAATATHAHARLVTATPAALTVASASEIRLKFSEGVEPRFSGVTLTAADGSKPPLGQPRVQGGDASVLVVPITKALAPAPKALACGVG